MLFCTHIYDLLSAHCQRSIQCCTVAIKAQEMAVSDRASEHDSSEGDGLDDEQYQWLQEQLAHIGQCNLSCCNVCQWLSGHSKMPLA